MRLNLLINEEESISFQGVAAPADEGAAGGGGAAAPALSPQVSTAEEGTKARSVESPGGTGRIPTIP